jgi:vitamin B12 transporter
MSTARLVCRGRARAALLLLVLLSAAWLPTARLARAAEPTAPETVVVAATRMPTPELEVASSVTVVTAADIEARQERTFVDVLKDVPGLNVVQEGGPGGQTSVFIRGTNSNHVKVLIDGIDVSDPSNANAAFDFGQLMTQDIERVEVLRGPQSGLYGSDAIGGVINVITKSGSGPLRGSVWLEGGSFDTFNQSAGVRGSQDALHYTADVMHLHAGATPVTPLDLLAPGEQRNDDYYDNFTASTKLGFDVTKDFDLGLVARYTNTHLRYTGQDFSVFPSIPAAEQSESNTSGYYGIATAHLLSFGGAFGQTLAVAFTRNETATIAQPPTIPSETLNTGERVKLDWQGVVRLSGAHTLLLGLEDARDEITQPLSASMRIGSGYAELQSQLADRWYSSLNVRYDHDSLFGGKTTYRFAPAYLLRESDTKFKASVGTGFKAPTLSQLYQSFPPFFFANPDLQPETSVGWDAGVEQALAAGRVRLGATYFHNNITNLITGDGSGTSCSSLATSPCWANVGKATTDGVESFIEYRPSGAFTVRLDYTYTQATDDVAQQELLRRPKNKFNLIATWQATRALLLNLDVLAVSSWVDGNRDFSIPRLDAPGYTTVNVAASYALNQHLALFGRIDNLFDRQYQNPVGFMQPGFGAYAGVRAQL